MKKRILYYRQMIDYLLDAGDISPADTDWAEVEREHLIQISFFQHERLVHLIVTVTFAVLEILSLIFIEVNCNIFTIIFSGLLLVLLVPYIMHYMLLEREIHKMYAQFDRIVALEFIL